MFDVDECLRHLIQVEGSDLHLKVPLAPHVRVHGKLGPIEGMDALKPEDTGNALRKLLSDSDRFDEFDREGEVDFAYAADYKDVDPGSPFVPSHVAGQVQDGGDGGRDVAVAVNGTIVAVGETFTLAVGDAGELVSVMVPPESFKPGANDVRVYLVP